MREKVAMRQRMLCIHVLNSAVRDFKCGREDRDYFDSTDFYYLCSLANVLPQAWRTKAGL